LEIWSKSLYQKDGLFLPSVDKGFLKLVVFERHKQSGHIVLGIVKGFELKSGAIATSIAHDSIISLLLVQMMMIYLLPSFIGVELDVVL
jgi:adenine deaminase